MTERKGKSGEYWVVKLNGYKTVVSVGTHYIYECGSDDGWRLDQANLELEWLRRIRL